MDFSCGNFAHLLLIMKLVTAYYTEGIGNGFDSHVAGINEETPF